MAVLDLILFIIIELICLFIVCITIWGFFHYAKMYLNLYIFSYSGLNIPKNKDIIIKGFLTATEEPLISPLTETPCVYYNSSVDEYLNRRNYRQILSKSKLSSFQIKTSLGTIPFDKKLFRRSQINYLENFDFPDYSFQTKDIKKIPLEILKNIAKYEGKFQYLDSFVSPIIDIKEEIIPDNIEVYIYGKFQYSKNYTSINIKLKDYSDIFISHSEDGLKKYLKHEMRMLILGLMLEILTGIALGYVLLL